MKKQLLISILLLLLLYEALFGQANCSNPLSIPICPPAYLTNQTNAGMLDDAPPACNIPGEDLVYELAAPSGAQKIFVSIINATAGLTIHLEDSACGTGSCNAQMVLPGNSNLVFNVPQANLYYLWIDAHATVTFDISFGADTGTVWVSIPNTKGNLQFDSSGCASPAFQNLKPFYQVSYNSVFQLAPMTLAPLLVPGNMCIITYFKNTTGIEGIVKFVFDFNPAGFSSVTAPASVPGFYNAGNWVLSTAGNLITYTFTDAAGTGKGDFTGIPDTCIRYEFCFTIIPVSNNPVLTNVRVNMYSDGFGSGYSGYVSMGCCPAQKPNCLQGSLSGGGGGTSTGFGFAFDDPGAPLPLELLSFTVSPGNATAEIEWITGSEKNTDYFFVERSANARQWQLVASVHAAGNSNALKHYQVTDAHPLNGLSYYRLRQTDVDGTGYYSGIVALENQEDYSLFVSPNPVTGAFQIRATGKKTLKYSICNGVGASCITGNTNVTGVANVRVSELAAGLYVLLIYDEKSIIIKEKMLFQK